jgi:hypothetical protein
MSDKSEKVDSAKTVGALAPGERWSVGRRRDVVLRILRGASLEALSREVAVEVTRLEGWRDRALGAMDVGLRERGGDPRDAEIEALKARLGEALMENELLRAKAGHPGPFGSRRSKR